MRSKLEERCPKHNKALTCLEIEGIYYVYCNQCIKEKKIKNGNDKYEFCALKKDRAVKIFIEAKRYGEKDNKEYLK